ncbi:MAG: hypothetical protein AVDCRST_MAG18-2555, partial [uncultured Thermomicrobiales bacterium]
ATATLLATPRALSRAPARGRAPPGDPPPRRHRPRTARAATPARLPRQRAGRCPPGELYIAAILFIGVALLAQGV